MTRKLLMNLAAATILGLVSTPAAFSQDNVLPSGFKIQPVLKTTMNRDNEPIVYPTGKPEIVSAIGTLDKGGRTSLHTHPVPVYVYVLEGEIELKSEGGAPHRYKAGEAFIETVNRKHQAFNVAKKPSKVLVVFIGQEGMPTMVEAK